MINFSRNIKYFMRGVPTDMRNGWQGLADIVRQKMEDDPNDYEKAFIFYSKDCTKVKILHFDLNGWVLYSKWFTDGKFLQPVFAECAKSHKISRETLIVLMSTAVQRKIHL